MAAEGTAADTEAARLRALWVAHTDARSGTRFYSHSDTNERRWIRPDVEAVMPKQDVELTKRWQQRLHEHYLINRPIDAWREVERAWTMYQRTLRESRALLNESEVHAVAKAHATQLAAWQRMCRATADQSRAMQVQRRRSRSAAVRAASAAASARRQRYRDAGATDLADDAGDGALTSFVSSLLRLDEAGQSAEFDGAALFARPGAKLPSSAFRARYAT